MVKKSINKSKGINSYEAIGFLLALLYMQSVLTVAHHTSMWMHNGSSYIVEAPAVPALVISLILVAYSAHKNKMKISTLSVITITILAVASLFWVSGLRSNFFN